MLLMRNEITRVNHPLTFTETGQGTPRTVEACPQIWGDVILARSDIATSYHLCVVCDDALQQVSHVVRRVRSFSCHPFTPAVATFISASYPTLSSSSADL